MRHDGDVRFLIIEYKEDGNDEWRGAGDCGRFIPTEKHSQFTACGEVWQRTGYFGCFDQDYAQAFMLQLSKENPGIRFRLRWRRWVRETEDPILEAYEPGEMLDYSYENNYQLHQLRKKQREAQEI